MKPNAPPVLCPRSSINGMSISASDEVEEPLVMDKYDGLQEPAPSPAQRQCTEGHLRLSPSWDIY